jgi:hypothetical protein
MMEVLNYLRILTILSDLMSCLYPEDKDSTSLRNLENFTQDYTESYPMLFLRQFTYDNIMVCLLKATIVKPAQTSVARQWLSSRYLTYITDTHATIKKLLEEMFSVR